MQTLIDLSHVADLEERRVLVRDRLAGGNVRPWTQATVHLRDSRSFVGTCPELAWLIGEPLIDANGDYPPRPPVPSAGGRLWSGTAHLAARRQSNRGGGGIAAPRVPGRGLRTDCGTLSDSVLTNSR